MSRMIIRFLINQNLQPTQKKTASELHMCQLMSVCVHVCLHPWKSVRALACLCEITDECSQKQFTGLLVMLMLSGPRELVKKL